MVLAYYVYICVCVHGLNFVVHVALVLLTVQNACPLVPIVHKLK